MFPYSCPQCKLNASSSSNRLVKDSCGHQKCRICLLKDVNECQQCKTDQQQSVIRFENNQTRVITRNGTSKKTDACTVIQNGSVEHHLKEKTKPPSEINKNVSQNKTTKNGALRRNAMIVPSHIIISKDPVQYKCSICKKQFATKSHIKYHIYCTGQPKPFRCNICDKQFVLKSHLHAHLLKHADCKPYTCSVCEKSFLERGKLKRHSLLHSCAKPHVCAECGKAFRGKDSLTIHTLIHRGEKPFSCFVCSMKFTDKSNLNKHLISHSNEKAHMCDQCGKRFKLKWALTVHRRSHSRLKPHECSTCSRSFVNNKDLQRHQLIHLETKAFTCSICNTAFRRKDNLCRHVKNTHPGRKVDPISSTVKQLLVKPAKPVDNPNAINVITASPSLKKAESITKTDTRNRVGFNCPPKLAFKTSAFKNCYNIHRNVDYDSTANKSYDMVDSMAICQKILTPHSPPVTRNVNEPTSKEIYQKILSPYPTRPVHILTPERHPHQIKFKLPPMKISSMINNVNPLKPVSNVNLENELLNNNNNTYTELKPIQNCNATSVIVNSDLNQSMHWRRRTSQNFFKILEN